jgi:probable HAF family extracellular repeat protein
MFLAQLGRLSAVSIVLSIAVTAAAQDAYKFTPLGTRRLNYINDYGQISANDWSTQKAFIWTPSVANGTTGTFTEFVIPDAADVFAVSVNDVGQVIGYYKRDSSDYVADSVAFLWTPTSPNGTSGTLIDVEPTLPGPGYGLNNLGQVTLGTASLFTGHEVFLWTPDSGGLSGTTIQMPYFEFHRVNDYGQVAGDGYVQDGIFFLRKVGAWTPTAPNGSTGGFTFIQDLNPDGEQVFADVNAGGQIVGGYDTTVESEYSFYHHAFLWTPATPNGTSGTTVDIDPVATSSSVALRVNDSGHVVGYFYRDGFAAAHGFIYRDGQFIDLNSFVPANSGIFVESAWGINDSGQIIVSGTLNGLFSSFLLSPIKSDAEVVDLQGEVNALVINGALLPANGQSLTAKLNAAKKKIGVQDYAGAITDLQAFINQVKAFIKTGKISAANGQALIDAANAIIQYLSI